VVVGVLPTTRSGTTAIDLITMGRPDACATAERFMEPIWAGWSGVRMSRSTVRSANSLRRWMPRTSTSAGGRLRADAKALLRARSMSAVKAEAGRSDVSERDRMVDGGGDDGVVVWGRVCAIASVTPLAVCITTPHSVSWVELHGRISNSPLAHRLHALHSISLSSSGPHVPTAKLTPRVHVLHPLHSVSCMVSHSLISYSFSAHTVQFAHTAGWVALHGSS
jgi:hypothetical protein